MPGMTSMIFYSFGTAALLYLFTGLIVCPSSLNAWFAPSNTSLLILLCSSFFMSALKSIHRRSALNQLRNGATHTLPSLGCMSPLSFKVSKTSTLVIPKSSKGRSRVALICPGKLLFCYSGRAAVTGSEAIVYNLMGHGPVTHYESALLIVHVPRPFRGFEIRVAQGARLTSTLPGFIAIRIQDECLMKRFPRADLMQRFPRVDTGTCSR
ncbi:uncharacterized protein G2W53_017931 [Senna tora]|uniref:Uncharacterized protein n=1 Tax=Senna tora TaxID=362788 RepID=A0A834TSS9_9FABA|nr:uncharacterized protein G2W53_017931 [Senna tora]